MQRARHRRRGVQPADARQAARRSAWSVAIAREVGRTPAQVLLRWGIQHGLVVLPKSVRRERIAENAALFDFALDAAQMAQLDALEEGLATGWDPDGAP